MLRNAACLKELVKTLLKLLADKNKELNPEDEARWGGKNGQTTVPI